MTNEHEIEHLVEKMDEFIPKKDVTKELSENVAKLEYGDLPCNVISSIKVTLLNTIGQMFSGATARSSRKIINYVRAIGGRPEATCIYYGNRTNIYNAALANGAFCSGLELPNMSRPELNFGNVVAPAALAICEREMANGHELITSIALGMEVTLRLASAAPNLPAKRPLNPISTFGPFGAAVAAGKLLRMDSFGIENALSCCPAQAAGTMQSSLTGSESERLIEGFAASYGLKAAGMVEKGVSGARNMLEGKAGFFMCISGLNRDGTPKFDIDRVNEGFGEKWHLYSSIPSNMQDAQATCERLLVQAGLSEERSRTVSDIVLNLEDADDMTRLLSNLIAKGGQ